MRKHPQVLSIQWCHRFSCFSRSLIFRFEKVVTCFFGQVSEFFEQLRGSSGLTYYEFFYGCLVLNSRQSTCIRVLALFPTWLSTSLWVLNCCQSRCYYKTNKQTNEKHANLVRTRLSFVQVVSVPIVGSVPKHCHTSQLAQ